MSSVPFTYTELFPKRGDITGSNDQAFGKDKDVFEYVIGGIKANTITAVGTIAPGTTIVQYLFAPKIHYDLGGAPKMLIGNASNKLGEFSCVEFPCSPLKLFRCITKKEKTMASSSTERILRTISSSTWTVMSPVPSTWVVSYQTSS